MNKTNNARKKNKSNKTSVVFNEASRKDFLTGFRKRKNERRKKAKDQLEKEYKEEVRRAKQKAKDDVIHSKATGASHQILPEVEHLIRGIGFLKNKINIKSFLVLIDNCKYFRRLCFQLNNRRLWNTHSFGYTSKWVRQNKL